MAIRVLDLFSGCGGMSWGLHKSTVEFDIVAGIDIDIVALQTFQRNHPKSRAINADLSVINPEVWLMQQNLIPDNIDCIVGGPPCQGFSKNVPRSQRFLDDPRNLLVERFLEFVRVIQPKVVIMENVAEIVNAFDGALTAEILNLLHQWGYNADVQVLDAADFGVPQQRRRAFFFASRCGRIRFPEPTYSADYDKLPLFHDEHNHITVWEAIGDLPSLKHGEGQEVANYEIAAMSDYQRKMRGNCTELHNHEAKKLSAVQYARLSALQPGEGAKELPEHLQPKSHYSGAYGRLTKDMVSRTLTRWMFHAGSGRFGHPVDIRTLTIREAARLQSFSDDFIFSGTFTQASSQIGNSVPPLIMEAFAPIIAKLVMNESPIIIRERT